MCNERRCRSHSGNGIFLCGEGSETEHGAVLSLNFPGINGASAPRRPIQTGILLALYPTKVATCIIELVSIDMVNSGEIVRIWNVSHGNHAMNRARRNFAADRKVMRQVATLVRARTEHPPVANQNTTIGDAVLACEWEGLHGFSFVHARHRKRQTATGSGCSARSAVMNSAASSR